jgi:hypothetical protein
MKEIQMIRVARNREFGNGRVGANFLCLAFSLFFLAGTLQAQNSIEMFANSYAGPVPNGPSSTQTVQLLADPAPGVPPGTPISVTATLSNQQFTGVGTGPGNPVVVFGGRRADGTTTINTTPVFDEMNTIAAPADNMFSSLPNSAPAGISVVDNFAFSFYSSIQQWEGLSVPATNSKIYLADLTLTFSSPVTNPYVQLVGMGGFVGPLGYATELTLTTPGLTLTKLQGNAALVVSGNEINNGNATGISTACNNDTAGCGTVRINGTGITTVTFQIYIRGDGGAATWSLPNRNEGDFWMLGVSVPFASTAADVSVAGRVIAANGRGIRNARVQLTTPLGEIKYATTNPFGYYRFDGLEAGQSVVLRVSSKQYTFTNPVLFVSLDDSAFDLNFVAVN